ncbi:class I adenylate-forming enzyme family protein [Nocardioides sp. Kera G14]|uniref:class I adenylate-forming enzyme family protein n=1 Tax=Nocardioides sp. Kera G14 TaxID=2884264 RepID=UPI001D103505|nr:AMP-binding protein [Nocardioides sp. Kera G14]UDY23325.1 AMP-binding protein [Nocardioides sp. Kera G14]
MTYLPWQWPSTYADRDCVSDDHRALTYDQVSRWVDATAAELAERGVTAGDVVAVRLPNRIELLITILAAWRLGAAATPVNPAFTETEAGHQITDSGAVLVIDDAAQLPEPGTLATRALPEPPSDPDALAMLIYTSGSTGRPKGVELTHANLDAMSSQMADHMEITPDDHCLLILPLFHANAIFVSFLTPIRAGGRLTIMGRFHPTEFLQRVGEIRPTYFSGVPTIYQMLVAQAATVQADFSSLRFAICGAAPASRELLTAVEETFGIGLIEGYGLTEGTCASTVNPLHGPRKLGTVGVALPGQTVAIMREDGTFAPTGERGEVVIQGPTVMRGYLNRPDATAGTLRPDANGDVWLHTGDVGVLDDDGYLTLVDRIKDMIIRGGENLYPKEIEAALTTHPGVVAAAVVGAPDPVYGEVPVAFVTIRPDASVTEDDLLRTASQHLTRVKLPTRIEILDALPLNPVGKVDKPALRARLTTLTSTVTTGA